MFVQKLINLLLNLCHQIVDIVNLCLDYLQGLVATHFQNDNMQTTDKTRQDSLAGQFNEFVNRVAGTSGRDYYARLSTRDFVELKTVLSNINNIITQRITFAFAEWLYRYGIVDARQYAAIRCDIERTNANANGYDVQFSGRVGHADGIVAEVKCNIPAKSDRFGAAQLANLEKDVEGLLHGKTKAKGLDSENYLKFLVLLDDGERVRTAAGHFVSAMQKNGCNIVIADTIRNLQTDTVYVIILKL